MNWKLGFKTTELILLTEQYDMLEDIFGTRDKKTILNRTEEGIIDRVRAYYQNHIPDFFYGEIVDIYQDAARTGIYIKNTDRNTALILGKHKLETVSIRDLRHNGGVVKFTSKGINMIPIKKELEEHPVENLLSPFLYDGMVLCVRARQEGIECGCRKLSNDSWIIGCKKEDLERLESFMEQEGFKKEYSHFIRDGVRPVKCQLTTEKGI